MTVRAWTSGAESAGGVRRRHFAWSTAAGTCAHLVATVNPALRDEGGAPVGALGALEGGDDAGAACELLAAATAWLRDAEGRARIWAPFEQDIWHPYRLMVRGFDTPPFPGEPRNPAFYPGLFRRAGFRVRKSWTSLELRGRAAIAATAAAHASAYAAALARGHRFTRLREDAAAGDVAALHGAVMRAFAGMLGYTPCATDDYATLFARHAAVVRPLLATLARGPDGATAGFAIAYPDVLTAGGRAVFHSIGVVPDAQGQGLGAALFHRTLRNVLAAGFDHLVVALVADDSPAYALLRGAPARREREYALFEAGA